MALALSCLDDEAQRQALEGATAADLARISSTRAEFCDDAGAIALAAWAAAEVAGISVAPLLRKLDALLAGDIPIATEDCSWLLAAALAVEKIDDTSGLAVRAARRLAAAQGPLGLFSSVTPAPGSCRRSTHVGRFADQVCSIQALARLHAAHGGQAALAAAQACADRMCELQGADGQWWWLYDVRDGSVAEKYPVYSVHQYATGPMAFLDLREAGGKDHWGAIARGLGWLDRHPELAEPIVSDGETAIWRKTTRRGPAWVARAVSAATTRPPLGLPLAWLDRLFPPDRVHHECRPCDLGWLLYAWLSGGRLERLRRATAGGHP